MKIKKGKQKKAVRVVVYGSEGSGKTTLVASLPKVLILDTEQGSNQLDVDRVPITSWDDIRDAFGELLKAGNGNREYDTLAVDSISVAETMLASVICQEGNRKSLADFDFGKGNVRLAERFTEFLKGADKLIARGYNVVMVGHSITRTQNDPEIGSFDRFEIDLQRQTAPLLKRWADCVAFLKFQIAMKEPQNEKKRAVGGTERVLHTAHTASYDAKSRIQLPSKIGGDFKEFKAIFSSKK